LHYTAKASDGNNSWEEHTSASQANTVTNGVCTLRLNNTLCQTDYEEGDEFHQVE